MCNISNKAFKTKLLLQTAINPLKSLCMRVCKVRPTNFYTVIKICLKPIGLSFAKFVG